MITIDISINLKLEVLIKLNKDRMGVGYMESEMPDFKDWHELKEKRKEIFLPNGKSFLKLVSYVKCESPDKIFEGISASFFGKEIFKVWIGPDRLGNDKKLIALLLEDGSWAMSLPIRKDQDASKFFFIEDNSRDLIIKINILTESGWKVRVMTIE
ncbi:MAG: hypothetical protein ACYC3G_02610 [Minisyncoccota bacterium]